MRKTNSASVVVVSIKGDNPIKGNDNGGDGEKSNAYFSPKARIRKKAAQSYSLPFIHIPSSSPTTSQAVRMLGFECQLSHILLM